MPLKECRSQACERPTSRLLEYIGPVSSDVGCAYFTIEQTGLSQSSQYRCRYAVRFAWVHLPHSRHRLQCLRFAVPKQQAVIHTPCLFFYDLFGLPLLCSCSILLLG